jgi:hypothetical protein
MSHEEIVMNHEEIVESLGVYALDALDEDEALIVKQHLEECMSCSLEVLRYREVAGKLGSSTVGSSSALWEKIERSLELEVPEGIDGILADPPKLQLLGSATSDRTITSRSKSHRSRRRAILTSVGSIAAAVMLVLGFEVSHLSGQVSALRSSTSPTLSAVASAALSNPSAKVLSLRSTQGRLLAEVAILPSGQSYFLGRAIVAVNNAKTYQLWAIADGRVVSLGVLGAKPQVYSFVVQRNVTQLMLNIEPEGGVTVPTTPVIATAKVV